MYTIQSRFDANLTSESYYPISRLLSRYTPRILYAQTNVCLSMSACACACVCVCVICMHVCTFIPMFNIRLFLKICKTNPQLTRPQLGVTRNLRSTCTYAYIAKTSKD